MTLFHHRPDRTDEALDELARRYEETAGVNVRVAAQDTVLQSVSASTGKRRWATHPMRWSWARAQTGWRRRLTLARAGLEGGRVYEGDETPGGGCRTGELTLPGFAHDVCSTVHPLLAASPFFTEKPLSGLSLKTPEVAFAHPLDGGRAAAVSSSVEHTAATLGADARAYRRLFGPLAENAEAIVPSVLAPLLSPPAHPLAMARFGLRGLWPVTALSRAFEDRVGTCVARGTGSLTRCDRSARPAPVHSHYCWGYSRTRWGGLSWRAAAYGSSMR